ncbi:MAG: hypothetical protein EKK62_09550 [Acidimicrobiia bacterium]|nr:MAG: hypothetical protein EKK62_09550 [Acidimicrobiia bacterium]
MPKIPDQKPKIDGLSVVRHRRHVELKLVLPYPLTAEQLDNALRELGVVARANIYKVIDDGLDTRSR